MVPVSTATMLFEPKEMEVPCTVKPDISDFPRDGGKLTLHRNLPVLRVLGDVHISNTTGIQR